MLTDIYVRDMDNDITHRVGDNQHDSLYVADGVVCYYNLQNGCGTLPKGNGTYEFVESDCGEIKKEQMTEEEIEQAIAQLESVVESKEKDFYQLLPVELSMPTLRIALAALREQRDGMQS